MTSNREPGLTAKETAEFNRLARKVNHLKATRREQSRYLELLRSRDRANAQAAHTA